MLNMIWDMETQDPDDFFTLLLLLGHPKVNLKAITITPGSTHQVGLVRQALNWFDVDIPLGAHNIKHPKPCVSQFHYRAYGNAAPSEDAEPAEELLLRHCDDQTTLITGAPLKNLGAAIRLAEDRGEQFVLGQWFAQGGFAGEGVVPPEKQLEKFRGRRTCPTFNLNGDVPSAKRALAYPGIAKLNFVSKHVCHGVSYDAEMHERFGALREKSLSLSLIWRGMEKYLRRQPEGKKFHDPLAACCAIDETIGTWGEVEIYRKRGEWGSRLSAGSNTWIITDYNHEKFLATLLMC